jgi:hypothetical protein
LLVADLDLLRNRVFAEDLAQQSWTQNYAGRGKRISSGNAGVAAIPCGIVAR